VAGKSTSDCCDLTVTDRSLSPQPNVSTSKSNKVTMRCLKIKWAGCRCHFIIYCYSRRNIFLIHEEKGLLGIESQYIRLQVRKDNSLVVVYVTIEIRNLFLIEEWGDGWRNRKKKVGAVVVIMVWWWFMVSEFDCCVVVYFLVWQDNKWIVITKQKRLTQRDQLTSHKLHRHSHLLATD
jgi:hypothetical protein